MFLYRLIAPLAAPILLAMGVWRILRGRESWGDLSQRLGAGTGQKGALWLHGASNGELTSARRLIEALQEAFPDRPLLITSNTVTARDMVRGWGLEGVSARLAPVDLTWVLARFRARWKPTAMIVLENEIWPNRIVTSQAPVFVVAARMSENSAGTWRKFSSLAQKVLPRIEYLYPQDAASGARFARLGLPADRLGTVTQLKSGVSQSPPDLATLQAFQSVFARVDTILAASTHEGDEALVLRAFRAARQTRPNLRLILAPRHTRRSAEIQALIAETGLRFAVRSQTPAPAQGCVIYLANTLGEMPLWYATAGVTIIGGTFSARGGHTPFEPAQFGSALIHGPDVANFAESYGALSENKAAKCVTNADDLAIAIMELADQSDQQAMAKRASEVLAKLDDSAAVIARIIADLTQRIGPKR